MQVALLVVVQCAYTLYVVLLVPFEGMVMYAAEVGWGDIAGENQLGIKGGPSNAQTTLPHAGACMASAFE